MLSVVPMILTEKQFYCYTVWLSSQSSFVMLMKPLIYLLFVEHVIFSLLLAYLFMKFVAFCMNEHPGGDERITSILYAPIYIPLIKACSHPAYRGALSTEQICPKHIVVNHTLLLICHKTIP